MAVRIERVIIIVLSVIFLSVWQAYAGNPNGPGTPPASTSSYTLEDIYNRLNNETVGSESAFTQPTNDPSTGTMHTLNEIMAKAPAMDNANGATAADVANGKPFWGLTESEWGLQTGTRETIAAVPKTGQTTCYGISGHVINCSGTGQDGDHQAGVAWLNPRFTDNNDGTVTDNLTGLIWLKNANCFGTQNWTTALTSANTLANGRCGLSDNTKAGDWRLPNRFELESLFDLEYVNPALSNTAGTGQWTEGDPFGNVQSKIYWSSSTDSISATYGWYVYLYHGIAHTSGKTSNNYVWPVRGGP